MRLCALCAYSTLIDVRPSEVLPLWRSAAPPSTCRERPLWRSARLLHAQPVANLRPWTFDFGPWTLQAFAPLRTPQFTHSFTNCQASHNILYVHPPRPTTGCGRGPNERQSPHQPCAIWLCPFNDAGVHDVGTIPLHFDPNVSPPHTNCGSTIRSTFDCLLQCAETLKWARACSVD